MPAPPKTLPADFFEKQAAAPETLPADFFDKKTEEAPPPPPPGGWIDSAVEGARGVAKGLTSSALGAIEAVRSLPGGSWLIPPPPSGVPEMTRQHVQPEGTAEKVGFGAEQIAEFFLPSGVVNKGVKAVQASRAPGAVKALARPALEATSAGVMAGVQSGGKPEEMGKAAGVTGAVTAALPVVGKVAKHVLGQTTGAGAEAVGAAMKPTPAFKEAMRGGIDEVDIVTNFKDAVQIVRDMRGAKYLDQLSKLPQAPMNPAVLASIRTKMFDKLASFGVKVNKKGLDWSRSTLQKDEAVENIVNDVMSWGSKADDLTPVGMDTLKRRIDNYFSPTRDSRAFIQTVKDEVRQTLNREVPGYAQMTSDYAKATDFINKTVGEFSLGPNAQTGTAVRKISNMLKQHNEYRKVLSEMLDEYVGADLKSQAAGYAMSKTTPRGLMGPLSGMGLLTAISTGVLSPKLAVAAMAGSPRLVGETLVAMSKLKPAAGAIPRVAGAAVTDRIPPPPQ